jgi:hypothetical protein
MDGLMYVDTDVLSWPYCPLAMCVDIKLACNGCVAANAITAMAMIVLVLFSLRAFLFFIFVSPSSF